MAFKRTPSETFPAKVTVNVVNDKGGYDVNTFQARFRRPDAAELKELRSKQNDEVVRATIVGWDLVDEDTKEAVPFSNPELEAILLIHPSDHAIATAFWETVSAARAKN